MKNSVNTAGVVRIVLYVIGVLCGLAALILPQLGIVHLTGMLTALAGAAATITGGTAVFNVPKAKDQRQDLSIAEIGGALLAVIREGQALAASTPAQVVDAEKELAHARKEASEDAHAEYVGQHRAPSRFSLYE